MLEAYNSYATKHHQSLRELDPIKNKFRALVSTTKPTGDPSCPVYIREAKATQKLIDQRAHLTAIDDVESDNEM